MEFKVLGKKDVRKPGEMRIILVNGEGGDYLEGETLNIYKRVLEEGLFKGKKKESFFTIIKENNIYQKTVFIGIGDKKEIDMDCFKNAVGTGIKKAVEYKCKDAEIIFPPFISGSDYVKNAVEASLLAAYKFDKYINKKEEGEEKIELYTVKMIMDEGGPYEEAIYLGSLLGKMVLNTRNLVNEPANILSPEVLAESALALGEEYNLEVEVLKEKEIEKLGMKAFLAVADGADNPPRLIVMRYQGNKEKPEDILGLVGKGIVYDTGGLSLKPSKSMENMKTDMAGAASVISAMAAIAGNNLPVNVTCVVAACENAVGGNYRPGDIISSMSGKSIYIANTDAEGRLTLADAMHYITHNEKVTKVLDIATLTGAAEVALGVEVTAVLANNDIFYQQLEQAAKLSGEKIWRLPTFEEYKELNKAKDADIANSGGPYGGAITAGLFVGDFVAEGIPWIHMDIAGPSWTEKVEGIRSYGATGNGTTTLYYLASALV